MSTIVVRDCIFRFVLELSTLSYVLLLVQVAFELPDVEHARLGRDESVRPPTDLAARDPIAASSPVEPLAGGSQGVSREETMTFSCRRSPGWTGDDDV